MCPLFYTRAFGKKSAIATATERARRDETGGESISSAQHAGLYLFSRSFARAHVSRGVGGVERVRAWVD